MRERAAEGALLTVIAVVLSPLFADKIEDLSAGPAPLEHRGKLPKMARLSFNASMVCSFLRRERPILRRG